MGSKPLYQGEHALVRKALLAEITYTGKRPHCCYCGGALPSDTSQWDLAHQSGRTRAWRGFAHQTCNRSDTANRSEAARVAEARRRQAQTSASVVATSSTGRSRRIRRG